jgi:hypothetical protein
MNIFKIIHPNGCPAQVRAQGEQLAIDMLVRKFNDKDWEFGQTSILKKEAGSPGILTVGEPAIPTADLQPRAVAA